MMRLDKLLSECTPLSRKEIKQLVKQGAVTVNGQTVKSADMKADETNDIITLSGERIEYKKYIYLMLNKPAGYVSATEDRHYPVVTELLPEKYRHYEPFCVGRLDIDTEGLLILTNDGEYAHKMTSPKKEVYKKYFAVLDKPAEEKDIEIFAGGIPLSDFTAKPAKLEICENPKEVYISICEGKFHQVKRMCGYVGKEVEYLKRISMGDIVLDESLKPGEVKELSLN